MKSELFARMLEGVSGVRKEGAGYRVPETVELSVFVGLASEVITVPRLERIELSPDILTLETQRGERFCFPMERIDGLKSEGQEHRAASHGAGFR